ncbi:MAG: hypothetical protein L0Z53_02895 [Acidobacteriales bacterium]|nr:hypothetical protein [Terriglobales bacterium]
MPATDLTVNFGSTSGSTFAFYFFLAITIVMGAAVYTILTSRLPEELRQRLAVTRLRAVFLSGLFTVLVFATVYFSMIYGFYDMRIHQDKLYLTYILPKHTVVLAKSELSEGMRSPAYRGRWYLTVYTKSGRPYQSVASSYTSVLEGWKGVQSFLKE